MASVSRFSFCFIETRFFSPSKYNGLSLDAVGSMPVPPSKLPAFQEDIEKMSMVESYVAEEKLDELVGIAREAVVGLEQYCDLAGRKWDRDTIRQVALCDQALAFQDTYESVHKLIRATDA